jgi:hypothetical protein
MRSPAMCAPSGPSTQKKNDEVIDVVAPWNFVYMENVLPLYI